MPSASPSSPSDWPSPSRSSLAWSMLTPKSRAPSANSDLPVATGPGSAAGSGAGSLTGSGAGAAVYTATASGSCAGGGILRVTLLFVSFGCVYGLQPRPWVVLGWEPAPASARFIHEKPASAEQPLADIPRHRVVWLGRKPDSDFAEGFVCPDACEQGGWCQHGLSGRRLGAQG